VSKIRKFSSLEEEALELAIRTRAKIFTGNYNPLAVVRSCYTIAECIGINEDLIWLWYELNGYPEYVNSVPLQVPQYRTINLISTFQNYPFSVRESIQQLTGLIKRKTIMTVTVNSGRYNLSPAKYESVVEHVINKCLLFLNRVTTELQFGGAVEFLMEEIRRKTDSKLSDFGDAMIAEAQSLYKSLISNNPADWSKVGHSCRRMLEILADFVFPARTKPFIGKDGQPHIVGQEQYVNRLVCYVDQKTNGSERKFLISEIKFFASYLDCLKEDLCSLEHNTSFGKKYHVNLAAIRTYLLVSELIRLHSEM
jgi:hypothetical protein